MSINLQNHAKQDPKPAGLTGLGHVAAMAAAPLDQDIAPDEVADFGYLFTDFDNAEAFLSDTLPASALDELASFMNAGAGPDTDRDSTLPPVFTYWGQFLDHELTARTDRDTVISKLEPASPIGSHSNIEAVLKNARTPRFDLDSVYGALPFGPGMPAEAIIVSSALRDPDDPAKMRLGQVEPAFGPAPDELEDTARDLPRFLDLPEEIRDAFMTLVRANLGAGDQAEEKAADIEANLDKRALIGDMRNDENLIVAQFHLSFLKFHNATVEFLRNTNTGWIADFNSAKTLTKLHYQDLIIRHYIPSICDQSVVDAVVANQAQEFFEFRAAYETRNPTTRRGSAIPLEFSVAAFRFGHTMVRNGYDYNRNFGAEEFHKNEASLEDLFKFTGGGGLEGLDRLPINWVIDWKRMLGEAPVPASTSRQSRFARSLDTGIAPTLADLPNEGAGESPSMAALLRNLVRRNLRRGLSLRMPTGQALHEALHQRGIIATAPNTDVANWLQSRDELANFLRNSPHNFNSRTPLWFYILAEAEGIGGNHLGPLGSWIVASTFVASLVDDPDSAISRGFTAASSPLRQSDGTPISTLSGWMRFAGVMEQG